MNKDQSIITQVAAKIAADLTPPYDDVNTRIASWLDAFDAVREALFNAHAFGEMVATPATTYTQPVEQQVQMVTNAFPTATQTQGMVGSIRIKGSQHGPIPEWLVSACAKDGVTEVWDNRDGLAVNPKRPWFKAVQGEQAYWEPKARK
jgi:hypothetical protein